jgi:hypothetical protein
MIAYFSCLLKTLLTQYFSFDLLPACIVLMISRIRRTSLLGILTITTTFFFRQTLITFFNLSKASLKSCANTNMLPKITTMESSKFTNISRITVMSTPLAGNTPSGINFGLNNSYTIYTIRRSDVLLPNHIWWNAFDMSISITFYTLKPAHFSVEYFTFGITYWVLTIEITYRYLVATYTNKWFCSRWRYYQGWCPWAETSF